MKIQRQSNQFITTPARVGPIAAIAARAGISTRTFFRYFDSKEQAVPPGHRPLWETLSQFSPSSGVRSNVAAELRILLRSTVLSGVDHAERSLHERIARQFQSNPHLHAVAAVQEAAYAQHLHNRLLELFPRDDALGFRALAESSMALWRTAWWHWGAQLNADAGSDPADSFDAAEAAMRAYPVFL